MRLKLTPELLLLEQDVLPPRDTTNACVTRARLAPQALLTRQVQITREKYSGFGLTLRGGRDQDQPICISCISRNSPADRCRSLFVGDQLLEVNGQSLITLTHEQAVRTLKNAGPHLTLVVQHSKLPSRASINQWQSFQPISHCWCDSCTDVRERAPPSQQLLPVIRIQDRVETNSPFTKRANKENVSSLANTPKNQSLRRSARFKSLWRSSCYSKSAHSTPSTASPASPACTKTESLASKTSTVPSTKTPVIDRSDPSSLPMNAIITDQTSASPMTNNWTQSSTRSCPLQAGATTTCRSVKLLHTQLSRYINYTDNARRNGFEMRWPSAENCGTFCSALIHCTDSAAAGALFHTFDEYVRLLKLSALQRHNVSQPPNKRIHYYGWAAVASAPAASSVKTPNSLSWRPMYVLIRGGQLQLFDCTPDSLSESNILDTSKVRNGDSSHYGSNSRPAFSTLQRRTSRPPLCEPSRRADHRRSRSMDSAHAQNMQLQAQLTTQFEQLCTLLASAGVRCTFTCECCNEMPTRLATRASEQLSTGGTSSPDSTLGCSIGSSVSSSLGSQLPPPTPPPKLPTSATVLGVPTHSMHAYATLLRKLRADEQPNRRTTCILAICAQSSNALYICLETDEQVSALLSAWVSATYASVQQVSRKSFNVMSDGRVGLLTLDWLTGICFEERGIAQPRWRFKFSQLKSSSDDGGDILWLSFATPGRSVETKRLRCSDLQPLLFCMHAFLSARLTAVQPSLDLAPRLS